jgi:putative membrane protein
MNKPMAFMVAAAVAAAWPFAATSQQAKKSEAKSEQSSASKMSQEDMRRFASIAQANMAEIELGKLAQEKGKAAEVKDFAKHMIDDHGKKLEENKELAGKKQVKLPDAPNKEQQATKAKLEKLSADDFDRAYAKQMVDDHQKTLKLVQDTAKNAKDADLKAAAEKAAPGVEKHLQMAKGLQTASAGASKGAKADHKK